MTLCTLLGETYYYMDIFIKVGYCLQDTRRPSQGGLVLLITPCVYYLDIFINVQDAGYGSQGGLQNGTVCPFESHLLGLLVYL